ncbi:MAG: hypothetical protein Kow0069_26990 [Promethearchaeota archaeon]
MVAGPFGVLTLVSSNLESFFTYYAFFFSAALACEVLNQWVGRWKYPHPDERIVVERFELRVGPAVTLVGDLVFPPPERAARLAPEGRSPVAVLLHGYDSSRGQLDFLKVPLLLRGFAVLAYDQRGHGDSTGDRNDFLYIMRDLERVLDALSRDRRLDAGRIVVAGVSMGAGVALTEGYRDGRVRHVVALAAWSDYRTMVAEGIRPLSKKWWIRKRYALRGLNVDPSLLQSNLVSPAFFVGQRKGFFGVPVPWDVDDRDRVLLLHCADDYVVERENFDENVGAFGLGPDNATLFEQGGHAFYKQEASVVAVVSRWLGERGL